jgi:hypothetical protein
MENQDIKWETWGEQPQDNNEQPQVNWGEPSQEENIPSWGGQESQPQQENFPSWGGQESQPQQENFPSWGGQIDNNSQNELNTLEPTEDNSFSIDELGDSLSSPHLTTKNHSFLGLLPKLKIEALIYKIEGNNKEALQEIIESGFEPVDKDNKYKISPKPEGELLNILKTIREISNIRGMEIDHSFLYKNSPNESNINISRGECLYSFVYFIQADSNSGELILDLSALNGPAEQVLEASPGILVLLPGWVPFRISKNQSKNDMVAIGGRFIIPRD